MPAANLSASSFAAPLLSRYSKPSLRVLSFTSSPPWLAGLADDLLGEELHVCCLLLRRTAIEAPHVWIAIAVERRRLPWRAADADHLVRGQLVGEGAGQRRPAEHGERLVLACDLRRVGAAATSSIAMPVPSNVTRLTLRPYISK